MFQSTFLYFFSLALFQQSKFQLNHIIMKFSVYMRKQLPFNSVVAFQDLNNCWWWLRYLHSLKKLFQWHSAIATEKYSPVCAYALFNTYIYIYIQFHTDLYMYCVWYIRLFFLLLFHSILRVFLLYCGVHTNMICVILWSVKCSVVFKYSTHVHRWRLFFIHYFQRTIQKSHTIHINYSSTQLHTHMPLVCILSFGLYIMLCVRVNFIRCISLCFTFALDIFVVFVVFSFYLWDAIMRQAPTID